ncbi:uncharacterized protein MONBRDRAFT_29581 [Monosiga brevicollis MX1]|uniref:SAM domain-containing protein n=1 Tax=Monosiga brevicollis TaxID=81824 RepID=A9VBI4_MONBE|nr:uncharacterized protein MONBRDRAFT_29581 [Monosiga brevicollis MX1]EDQ85104.1 predicted protein [Monosiga brevicollis MX1]|eukprot:XP_001750108.1 hypothetical protein [Monosiga brevicollis MX1]
MFKCWGKPRKGEPAGDRPRAQGDADLPRPSSSRKVVRTSFVYVPFAAEPATPSAPSTSHANAPPSAAGTPELPNDPLTWDNEQCLQWVRAQECPVTLLWCRNNALVGEDLASFTADDLMARGVPEEEAVVIRGRLKRRLRNSTRLSFDVIHAFGAVRHSEANIQPAGSPAPSPKNNRKSAPAVTATKAAPPPEGSVVAHHHNNEELMQHERHMDETLDHLRRQLTEKSDNASFADHPVIQALDPAAPSLRRVSSFDFSSHRRSHSISVNGAGPVNEAPEARRRTGSLPGRPASLSLDTERVESPQRSPLGSPAAPMTAAARSSSGNTLALPGMTGFDVRDTGSVVNSRSNSFNSLNHTGVLPAGPSSSKPSSPRSPNPPSDAAIIAPKSAPHLGQGVTRRDAAMVRSMYSLPTATQGEDQAQGNTSSLSATSSPGDDEDGMPDAPSQDQEAAAAAALLSRPSLWIDEDMRGLVKTNNRWRERQASERSAGSQREETPPNNSSSSSLRSHKSDQNGLLRSLGRRAGRSIRNAMRPGRPESPPTEPEFRPRGLTLDTTQADKMAHFAAELRPKDRETSMLF